MGVRTVLLVGTHQLGWSQLRAALARLRSIEILEAPTASEAVATTMACQPTVVFLAPDAAGSDALQLIADLRHTSPSSRLVVFAARYDEVCDPWLLGLRDLRAAAYIVWSDLSVRALTYAVGTVLEADVSLANRPITEAFHAAVERERRLAVEAVTLTARKQAVLVHVWNGLSHAQIAAREHVGLRTVDRAVEVLFTKLEARSLVDLGVRATHLGLLPPP